MIVSSAPRHPSFAVAPTQNTAPVLEFQCLFSHDLRKKKKTWHDGSLRFHTFNKRVMVYDDAKNYIGDAHWREAEPLGEGEELKLDKGVMVEVGEKIGMTETDLAPLLERRRPEGAASSPNRVPFQSLPNPSSLRTAIPYSQTQPKSLASLLAASQGRMGRARLPVQSPYEQRNPVTAASHHEPPQKKQRTAGENVHGLSVVASGPMEKPRSSSEGQSVTPDPGLIARRKARERSRKEVIEISSEETSIPSSPRVSQRRETAQASTDEVSSMQKRGYTLRPTGQNIPNAPEFSNTANANPKRSNPTLSPAPTPVESSSTRPVVNKLRLVAEKPRPKLMYQKLLPQSKKPGLLPRSSKDVEKGPRRTRNSSKDSARSRVGAVSDLERDIPRVGQNDSASSIGRGSGNTDTFQDKSMKINAANAQRLPTSSPLFLPQSPMHNALPSQEDSPLRDFSIPPMSPLTSRPGMRAKEGLDAPAAVMVENRSAAEAYATTSPALEQAVPSKLTMMDQQLLVQHPRNILQPRPGPVMVQGSPRLRSFRRVVSEHDSPMGGRRGILPVTTNGDGLEEEPQRRVQGVQTAGLTSPVKIQRTVSDTTHVRKGSLYPAQAVNVAPVEEEVEAEVGAWSKKEAFLLFDWWPAGREKPEYGGAGRECGETQGNTRMLSDQRDAL